MRQNCVTSVVPSFTSLQFTLTTPRQQPFHVSPSIYISSLTQNTRTHRLERHNHHLDVDCTGIISNHISENGRIAQPDQRARAVIRTLSIG